MGYKSVLILFVGVIGVGHAAAAEQNAFPLRDGNRWTLRAEDGGGTTAVSVRRSPSGLVLEGFPGIGDIPVRATGAAIEVRDAGSGNWEPFLRLGARAGTKYTVKLSDAPLWRSVVVTVTSRQAVVHDARGKTLRGCVRLTVSHPKGIADAGIEELVFAPGVGLVKVVEMTIAGPRERVLAAVRLGA